MDNPPVTYLALKANQLAVFIKDKRVASGADEVRLRKETYDPIKPATAQGCQRQIIDMGRRGISTLVCFSDKVLKILTLCPEKVTINCMFTDQTL